MAGVVGMPSPLRQVLSFVHSPGTRQMRLAGSPSGEVRRYPCDGIWRRPWEVLNDRSENRNQAPLETCTVPRTALSDK